MAEEKRNIRRRILSFRNEMPLKLREEKSNIIIRTLYEMERYKKAEIILTYADYQSEVITTPLISRALTENKQVFTPRVCSVYGEEMKSEKMEFYRISDIEDLEEGYKGIREPVYGEDFMEKIVSYKASGKKASGDAASVLMLIPGVVFDKDGHRIGYGKGFYDRYLKRMTEAGINAYKIALCYECQMLSEVPHENHDISVDMVITENGIYEKGNKYE
ncbi:MAG: 5-formyltetrahydrofolate cyclo-ligase [Lachnospiraceae bacterium]|nr:5-formyltetrahydrofolate cyclo-ligase [Lachnospiraceae bacterium]